MSEDLDVGLEFQYAYQTETYSDDGRTSVSDLRVEGTLVDRDASAESAFVLIQTKKERMLQGKIASNIQQLVSTTLTIIAYTQLAQVKDKSVDLTLLFMSVVAVVALWRADIELSARIETTAFAQAFRFLQLLVQLMLYYFILLVLRILSDRMLTDVSAGWSFEVLVTPMATVILMLLFLTIVQSLNPATDGHVYKHWKA